MTDAELLMLACVCIVVFAAVFSLVWSLFRYPVPQEPPVHRRIAVAVGAGERQTLFENPATAPIMALLQQIGSRFNLPALRAAVRRDLNASGNPNGYNVDEYIALSLFSGILIAIIFGFLTWLLLGLPDPLTMILTGLLGFGLPIWVLRGDANKRLSRISKRLPYSLDLIALMMASGATFPEAIATVIRDEPDDDFNQELAVVQSEIEFGTSRAKALQNLADRIPIESLRSVVGAINQSEALGTPLSVILKTQSGMMRQHRSVRAEKLSASASLRILVPSMLILIAVVIVALGPMAIRAITEGSLFVM